VVFEHSPPLKLWWWWTGKSHAIPYLEPRPGSGVSVRDFILIQIDKPEVSAGQDELF